MRLLSPDSWLSFQCESRLNMATETGIESRVECCGKMHTTSFHFMFHIIFMFSLLLEMYHLS